MPRRDGNRTISENAERDAKAVAETVIQWAQDHGYYGEPALRYSVELVNYVLDEITKPASLERLIDG